MSDVKYFGNYYAVLTKNQKDKYDVIQKQYYDALAIEKVRYKEFDELHDKFKECELYKEAEKYYKETVSIPIYSMLCNEEQERLIHCLYEIFE